MVVVPTPIVPVRVDDARKARWVAAAAAAGQKLSEWIRDVADAAAARVDGAPAPPVAKRGGHQPVAKGPAPTVPPAPSGPPAREWRGPDPKPVGKSGRR